MTDAPLLDWRPSYPTTPGFKVSGPSQEAAVKVSARVNYLQGKCLEALAKYGPMTADECAEKIGETWNSTRPRFTELLKKKRVEKTKERRKNISGCSATVWRLP